MNELDKSEATDRILTVDNYALIDSFAYETTRNVQRVSSLTEGQIAEGAEGKHVYSKCLDNYRSKWRNRHASSKFTLNND